MSIHQINGIKIRTSPGYVEWSAVDDSTYDCDCDQDGFFTTCPVGNGATEQAAIDDLLEQLSA